MKKKEHINLVVVGHIGSGKSTTSAHLIYKCGWIDKKIMDKAQTDARNQGLIHFKYAWVMNKLKSERQRCMTINTSLWQLQTQRYHYTVIDAPGHRDYIKNMIRGASEADCVLLMVALPEGEFEAGMSAIGQTREHILIAYTLGIKKIIVGLNKIDERNVQYSEKRYNQVKEEVSSFLRKVGYKVELTTPFIPISGWFGDNLVQRSAQTPWYEGPTLLEALDQIEPSKRYTDKPLRIPLRDVMKIGGIGTIVIGRVETGVLKSGSYVVFSPVNLKTPVKSIEIHGEMADKGFPGDIVGFNTMGISFRDLRRGYVCGEVKDDPPQEVQKFVAKIIVLNCFGEIKSGYTPIVHCHTANIACRIETIHSKVDKSTDAILQENPKSIKNGDSAIVTFKPMKPFCCEVFTNYPPLGRFIVRDMKQTIAVGVIKFVKKNK